MWIRCGRWLCAGVIAALGIGAGPASATPVELIANGGFETGSFAGWTVGNLGSGGCGTNQWAVNGTGAHGCSGFVGSMPVPVDGAFAAYNTFDGPSGALTLSQQIALPGSISIATLSFRDTVRWANYNPPGDLMRSVRVDLYDAANSNLLANLYLQSYGNVDQPWTLHVVDVAAALAPLAGQTVTFRLSNVIPQSFTGAAGFGADSISVLVPEPASALLLMGGLMGLAARDRRRRSRTP